jgi:hypothetical protein
VEPLHLATDSHHAEEMVGGMNVALEGLASLLVSGIMIVEGARDEKEAADLYSSLVNDGLGIPL